jgi:oxygen-independent coproporphyrinogen-3 oxidase
MRRRDGVDLEAFRAAYGIDVLGEYGGDLAPSFAAGLVEHCGSRLRLTERGVLLSNEVLLAFV